MASSLILNKRILTTLAKAKALRTYVEPLITKSKNDTTHSRRTVFSYLQNKEVTGILFREVAEKVASRPGGYTRILKLQNRLGDNAEMALIELVDYNETYVKGGPATEKKSTRRRGSKGKKDKTTLDNPVSADQAVVADKTAVTADEPVTDVEVQEEQTTAGIAEADAQNDEVAGDEQTKTDADISDDTENSGDEKKNA